MSFITDFIGRLGSNLEMLRGIFVYTIELLKQLGFLRLNQTC